MREIKIAREFGLTVSEAQQLIAADLDTPVKIKAADYTDIPEALRSKLEAWVPQG